MSNPKVSVIIPVYNVEQYLDTCMRSVLGQTLRDIEVILVDDGSPDRSPQMCDRYAQTDDRVHVVHKANGGLGFARNSGMEIARGDYITFIDSDDAIETTAYQTLYDIAVETDADVVYYDCDRFVDAVPDYVKSQAQPRCFSTPSDVRQYLCGIIAASPEQHIRPYRSSACMAMYRRKTIADNGLQFYSERQYINEDTLFNIAFLLHAHRVVNVPQRYYHYRENPKSLSHTSLSARYGRERRQYDFLCTKYREHDLQQYLDRWLITKACTTTTLVSMSDMDADTKNEIYRAVITDPVWISIEQRYPIAKLPPHNRAFLFSIRHQCPWVFRLIGTAKRLQRRLRNR